MFFLYYVCQQYYVFQTTAGIKLRQRGLACHRAKRDARLPVGISPCFRDTKLTTLPLTPSRCVSHATFFTVTTTVRIIVLYDAIHVSYNVTYLPQYILTFNYARHVLYMLKAQPFHIKSPFHVLIVSYEHEKYMHVFFM